MALFSAFINSFRNFQKLQKLQIHSKDFHNDFKAILRLLAGQKFKSEYFLQKKQRMIFFGDGD